MSENLPSVSNGFEQFEKMMEVSKFLAQSDLIPAHFKGKNANVFIALEFAMRHQMSPFLIMQGIYVVHGRPGLEAKLVIAMANKAGWHLQYDTKRDSAGKIVSCKAWSEKSGVKVYGPEITWDMVRAEGWDQPKGSMKSKWITMPELMFPYRAGTYFVRLMCPEVTFGLQTVEELEDVEPLSITTASESVSIQEDIPEAQATPVPQPQTFDDLWLDYSKGKPDSYANHIQNFLTAAAKHSNSTVDDIKDKAAGQWNEFVKSFEKWAKKQEKAASQPAPAPEPSPAPQETGPQTNGPVKAITDDQIDQIESLCRAKDMPLADALAAEGLPKDLIELDFDSAAGLIEKLAAL